ncbi:MAG: isoleucine--tRNA ligase, partial [Paramuribaculum sp.]|nr:isoleucine--tRNA ligase [Paramuribaculum sp.]
VKDTTCIAQFLITDPKEVMTGWGEPYFMAWTTTPWTLPSNTALAVGPEIEYSVVRTFNPYSGAPMTAVVATDLLGSVFNPKGRDIALTDWTKGDKVVAWDVVATFKGSELCGMHYEQLIPWVNPGEGAFRVIPGDYVSTEDGTGIVHIAGTFGADDLRVSRQAGVPPLHMIDRAGNLRPMVDMRGRFYLLSELDPGFVERMVNTDLYAKWQGRYVKPAYDPELSPEADTLDVDICMMLKAENKVFRIEKHTHNYPHCWRTDKPILYYPLDSWFIKTPAVRDRLISLNETIKWKPASTGAGRFGKWLENSLHWNLSRSRYWGTPLPIWRTDDGAEEICIDSVATLYAEIERAVAAGLMKSNPFADKGFRPGVYTKENYELIDLHRPYVDDIVLVSPSGRPMHRELDLIDVWFDSGSMPYAQIHYPFENKEAFEAGELFPADFIAEGVDQTRGWFFTLHTIATMVFDRPAYKAVVSNGLVLDKNGEKMSKRKGNSIDPFTAIDKFGSDPLRWYMMVNSQPWDNLKFDPDGVAEVSRKFFGTLHNTYSFFSLYANVDGFDNSAPQIPFAERPEIDRWILSSLNSLIKEVEADYDDYEPTRVARAISDFVIDNLSNWYVRLNRSRFWRGDMTPDKLSAYQTLWRCLVTVARLIAPIAPFYADRLYTDLMAPVVGEAVASVHLADFPVADESEIVSDLEESTSLIQRLTSLVLALRRKANLKVRQPLSSVMIPVSDERQASMISSMAEQLLNEINVKEIKIVGAGDGTLVKRVKPDFRRLGPMFGKSMKAAAAILTSLSQQQIAKFEADGYIDITPEGAGTTRVALADVEVISEDIPGWLVGVDGNLTVALDVDVTPELRKEGIARDIVNRIQNLRKKELQLSITDRITLRFAPGKEIEEVVADFGSYIASQVLATDVVVAETFSNEGKVAELDIDGLNVRVEITLSK